MHIMRLYKNSSILLVMDEMNIAIAYRSYSCPKEIDNRHLTFDKIDKTYEEDELLYGAGNPD